MSAILRPRPASRQGPRRRGAGALRRSAIPELGSSDLYDLSLGAWRRHGQAVLFQPVNVKRYSLADRALTDLHSLLAVNARCPRNAHVGQVGQLHVRLDRSGAFVRRGWS